MRMHYCSYVKSLCQCTLPPVDAWRLTPQLSRARDEAYERLAETIGSQRGRDLLLHLVGCVSAAEWAKHGAKRPVGKVAGKQFDAAWKRIRRRVAVLPDLEDRQLHRLRIRIKRLRYALEFMAALYPKKRTAKFSRSLERIQDCLGLVHDDIVARQMIDEFSLRFRVAADRGDRSRRLRKAEAHFRRLRRIGLVWSR